jgi:GT2 family glycosyltransferase
MKYDITASIVLFRNNPLSIKRVITSFLNTELRVHLFLIDNSPSDDLKQVTADPRCTYIFNNANLGFGKGHNIGLRKSMQESTYHAVLNPDIYFSAHTLEKCFNFMESNPDVGQIMPKILYPDNSLQYSGKLLPTPLDLLGRRLFMWIPAFKKRNRVYELVDADHNKIMNVPHLLGCFMFLRNSVLHQSGLFDEKIFMYTEDIDLTRRIHTHYKTLYYPEAQIYHHYERGSRKSIKLFLYHLRSTFQYFMKWGWFYDPERRHVNARVIHDYL